MRANVHLMNENERSIKCIRFQEKGMDAIEERVRHFTNYYFDGYHPEEVKFIKVEYKDERGNRIRIDRIIGEK